MRDRLVTVFIERDRKKMLCWKSLCFTILCCCCLVKAIVTPPAVGLLKETKPFRHHLDFMAKGKPRAMVSEYIQKWLADQPNYPIKRVNRILKDKVMAQKLWDALIGHDPARRELLRLRTRPGWIPIGFGEDVSPCVYKFKGASFPAHLDHDGDYQKQVILAKLMLYPTEFQGGELMFYTRDPSQTQRWSIKDSKLTHTIGVKAGSAVLFDLWYPHGVLPVKSETKEGLGLRVIYEKQQN